MDSEFSVNPFEQVKNALYDFCKDPGKVPSEDPEEEVQLLIDLIQLSLHKLNDIFTKFVLLTKFYFQKEIRSKYFRVYYDDLIRTLQAMCDQYDKVFTLWSFSDQAWNSMQDLFEFLFEAITMVRRKYTSITPL